MQGESRNILHGRQLLLQRERQRFLRFYLLFLLVLSNSGIRTQFLFALEKCKYLLHVLEMYCDK